MDYRNYYGSQAAHLLARLRRSRRRTIASLLTALLCGGSFLYFQFPALIRAAIEGKPAFAEPAQEGGAQAAEGIEHVALSAWIFAGVLAVGFVFCTVVFILSLRKYLLLKKALDPAARKNAQ